jgi:predicted amidophosphoribosyltransferase
MTSLLDLVLPTDCAGCGTRAVVVCERCLTPLRALPFPAWPRPSPRGLPPPFAVAAYDGPVRAMLLAVKEEGAARLQRPLGRALAHAVAVAAPPTSSTPVWLVPVPSSSAARRRRGEDVVRRLAAVAADELRRSGVRAAVVPALRHARSVADSAGLGAQARAVNLAGAFAARPRQSARLQGGSVVLVDDLITTGVTLSGCAAALREADVSVAGCATVAATQRHSP